MFCQCRGDRRRACGGAVKGIRKGVYDLEGPWKGLEREEGRTFEAWSVRRRTVTVWSWAAMSSRERGRLDFVSWFK